MGELLHLMGISVLLILAGEAVGRIGVWSRGR